MFTLYDQFTFTLNSLNMHCEQNLRMHVDILYSVCACLCVCAVCLRVSVCNVCVLQSVFHQVRKELLCNGRRRVRGADLLQQVECQGCSRWQRAPPPHRAVRSQRPSAPLSVSPGPPEVLQVTTRGQGQEGGA